MKIIITTLWILLCFDVSYGQRNKKSLLDHQDTDCVVALCTTSGISKVTVGSQGIGKQSADFFTSILDTESWPARWHCGTWSPFHGWLYISSDIVIWLSYFMIPAILGFFVYKKKREPIPFRLIVFLFIAFILACGLTHLVDASIFWWPAYKLSALIRFLTATVSLGTVFALINVTPKVLEFKSPDVLEQIVKERTAELNDLNARLQEEVNSRQRVELQLLQLNKQLAEKSERLELINEELIQHEVELKKSEAKVIALNTDLETKVELRTKELNAINEELEAFTYSVSHDLRAPLRYIDGFTNILWEDNHDRMDETGIRNLKVIIKNAQYMGQLIDDLLNFSKISRTKFVKQYFSTEEQVRSIIEDQIAQEKNRVINIEISALEHCRADISMLRQVWINLISNAIKYTRKTQETRIQIGSIRYAQEIHYFVKDNGIGFDMAYANKLFRVFERLHNREDFDGTGVGLALVKRIVERHGGRIWAVGKANEGASFSFSLPI